MARESPDYRPEIDGLRAIAIIPVVLFHLGFPWIRGGYLGVDVFFVISGYLITTLILRDHDRGQFGYTRFWLRRIRRIFPALVVMLVITSLAGKFLFIGTDLYSLGTTGFAALLSFANVVLWKLTNGYWGQTAETLPLLHTWSLSVEEQFYFLYPFLLSYLFRFSKKTITNVILSLALISFATYLYGFKYHPSPTFYLLPTRVWELACGCLLAIAQWKGSWKYEGNSIGAFLGLTVIIISFCYLPIGNSFPGATIFVVVGTLLVIAFATNQHGLARRLLATSPMVFVGKISYSLYLWHWPILVLTRNHFQGENSPVSNWILLSLIVIVSMASYYVVEKTTRHWDRVLPLAFAAFCVSGGVSFCLMMGLCASSDVLIYHTVLWRGRQYDVTPVQQEWHGDLNKRMEGIQAPMRDRTYREAYRTTGILKTYGSNGVDIVVLGDSHALMWAGVLDDVARDLKLNISFFTADGINPFRLSPGDAAYVEGWSANNEELFLRVRLQKIGEWRPKVVMLLTRWSLRNSVETTAFFSQLEQYHCRVLTIEQPPELFFGDKNAVRALADRKIFPKPGIRQYIHTVTQQEGKDYESGRNLITELETKYPFFHCIRISDIFLRTDSSAWVLDGNQVLYIDDDHLSEDGALKAKNRVRSAIESTLH